MAGALFHCGDVLWRRFVFAACGTRRREASCGIVRLPELSDKSGIRYWRKTRDREEAGGCPAILTASDRL